MKEIQERLQEMQEKRRLHPSWLKRDTLFVEEAVCVYYKIEPLSMNEPMSWHELRRLGVSSLESYIKLFDTERIYDILFSSQMVQSNRGQITWNEFIKLLIEKKIKIPLHFDLEGVTGASSSDKLQDKIDLSGIDLNQCSISDLKKLFIRTYAAYFWKTQKGENAKMSAASLVQEKEFLNAISYVNANEMSKLEDIISDLGPRRRKKSK
jgi:hypothetical protein